MGKPSKSKGRGGKSSGKSKNGKGAGSLEEPYYKEAETAALELG